MALNLISPSCFTTGFLIGNTTPILNGGGDSTPFLTKVDGKPADIALELQSDDSAFLATRLTQDVLDTMRADDGMIAYNKDTNLFNFHQGGSWEEGGNVKGPLSSIIGDIAIFADETGKVLADSGVNIAVANPPGPLSAAAEPFLKLSNISELSFTSEENVLTIDDRLVAIFNLPELTLEPTTIFTDSTFDPDGPYPSAILQINSKRAGFLNSRMSSAQVSTLGAPDGLQVYDETLKLMLFRQGGQWATLGNGGGGGGAPLGATYILGTLSPLLPNAQSLSSLETGLLKNTVDNLEGILSKAEEGVDYYAPGFPTFLRDTSATQKNLFFGTGVGKEILDGQNNLGLGINNLANIASSSGNISIGINTSALLSEGGGNVVVGNGAFNQAINAVNTLSLGNVSGTSQAFYDSCTFLGTGADASENNLFNATAIGADATVSSSNTVVLGKDANVVIGDTTAPWTLTVGSIGGQSVIAMQAGDTPTYPDNGGALYVRPGTISGYDLYFNGEKLTSGAFDLFSLTSFVVGSFSPKLPFCQSLGGLGARGTSGLLKNVIGPNILPGLPDKGTLSFATPVEVGGGNEGDYYAPGKPLYIKVTSPETGGNLFIGQESIGFDSGTVTNPNVNNTGVGLGVFTSLSIATANTAFGANALKNLEVGLYNTAVGQGAGIDFVGTSVNLFSGNTCVGTNSGSTDTFLENCTFVGYAAGAQQPLSGTLIKNGTAIGWDSTIAISNAISLGRDANVGVNVPDPQYTFQLANVKSEGGTGPSMCTIAFDNTETEPFVPAVGTGGFLYVKEDLLYYNGHLIGGISGFKGQPNNLFGGDTAGNETLTGINNIGVGLNVLNALTNGEDNIVYGVDALNNATTASSNIAFGKEALKSLETQQFNIAIGESALEEALNTTETISIGHLSGLQWEQYTGCIFLGYGADSTENALVNAIAIGTGAAVSQSNTLVLGSECKVGVNVAAPFYTFTIGNVANSCTLGLFNTLTVPAVPAAGEGGVLHVYNDLLYYNGNLISNSVSGEPNNLFVGNTVGNSTLSGINNVGSGLAVFQNLTSGSQNTADGAQASSALTNGSQNLSSGYRALAQVTGGNLNVALGCQAFEALTGVASGNTAVGARAGLSRSNLVNCTFLGYDSDALANDLNNATAIGSLARVGNSNSIVLGNDANIGNVSYPDYTFTLGNVHNNIDGTSMCVISLENTDFEPAVPGQDEGGRLYVKEDLLYYNGQPVQTGGGTGAPIDAAYVLATLPDPNPFTSSNLQNLGSLSTGLLKNTVSGGIGALSRAIPVPKGSDSGDYYGPGNPVHIIYDPLIGNPPVPPYSNLLILDSAPLGYGTAFRGSFNVAIGPGSFYLATEASSNTALGAGTLALAQTALFNTALGRDVLGKLVSGINNVGVGGSALMVCESSYNTGVGTNTLQYHVGTPVVGGYNTALGYNAGSAATSSFLQCTFIGAQVNATSALSASVTNSTAIGYGANVRVDNAVVLGNNCVVGIANSEPTYGLHVGASGTVFNAYIGIEQNPAASGPATPTTAVVLYNGNGPTDKDFFCATPTNTVNLTTSLPYYVSLQPNPENSPTTPNAQVLTTICTETNEGEKGFVFFTPGEETTGTLSINNTFLPYYVTLKANPENSCLTPNSQDLTTIADGNSGYVYYNSGGEPSLSIKDGTGDFAPLNARYVVWDDTDKPSDNCQVLKDLYSPTEVVITKVGSDGKLEKAKPDDDYVKYSTYKSKVDELDTEIDGIEGEITGIEGEIVVIEGEITELTEGLATVTGVASGAAIAAATALSTATTAIGEIDHLETETYVLRTNSSTLSNAQYLDSIFSGASSSELMKCDNNGYITPAVAGVDYYSPGNPTTILDSGLTSLNVFLGTNSGNSSITGTENSGFGSNVLNLLTTGSSNAAGGINSLKSLVSGFTNTAFGKSALELIVSSDGSTALGHRAGANQVSYTQCTFIGERADATVTGLTNATAIGSNAQVSTSNSIILGNAARVAIGTSNASNATFTLNNIGSICDIYLQNTTNIPSVPPTGGGLVYTSGDDLYYSGGGRAVNLAKAGDALAATYITQTANAALPNEQSLGSLTTGLLKNTVTTGTGVLSRALPVSPGGITGDYYGPGFPTFIFDNGLNSPFNLFMGSNAGTARNAISGAENIGIGVYSLSNLTLGANNIGIGSNCLFSVVSGNNNTSIGKHSGRLAGTNSSNNTFLGQNAGATQSLYNSCTFLGNGADASVTGLSNATAIGSGAIVGINNAVVLGTSITNTGIRISTPLSPLHMVGEFRQKGIASGYTGTDNFKSQVGIQTTNATATTILTIPIPTSPAGAVNVRFHIGAMQSTNANAGTGFGSGGAFYNGTTSALLTNTITFNTTLLWLASCAFAISGNNLVLNVTGIAGQTINWVVSYEYFTVRNVIT
ncbi:MAG TPA: hypothetical protein VHA52_09955 [Candidatus Babeliaceae bacterium]|nr:hypothetical protein [Candidatus Babeliaceae bacterium]